MCSQVGCTLRAQASHFLFSKYLGNVRIDQGRQETSHNITCSDSFVVIAAESKNAPPHVAFFIGGPQRLYGILGCATGQQALGRWPIDSGIALASGESTAASLPNQCLDYCFPSVEALQNKQDSGLAKALGLSAGELNLSYPLLVSAGRLCSPERNLGILAVLCRLKIRCGM
jgi:hypothetical protein